MKKSWITIQIAFLLVYQFYLILRRNLQKMMPELFWCWVGGVVWKGMSWGGGLWRVSHGMAFMGYMVCHVQLCYMAWHAWNTCRGLVMSWHDMEYMSGACHVRAWHGTHGIHFGDCHVMACMEYMSGIAMSWHAWNTCRGLPCHHASTLPCHVQWFKSWAVQPNTSAELWPD